MSDVLKARARLAGLKSHPHIYQPNDPAVVEATRTLHMARMEQHVQKLVAGWPPLTPEQRNRIAVLVLSAPSFVDSDGGAT